MCGYHKTKQILKTVSHLLVPNVNTNVLEHATFSNRSNDIF